jgi:hypothetical protein
MEQRGFSATAQDGLEHDWLNSNCHCERSEAIELLILWIASSRRALRTKRDAPRNDALI